MSWLPVKRRPLQLVLDDWADWHNTKRPHQALDGRPPLRLRARDKLDIHFSTRRASHRGLPSWLIPFIEVTVIRPHAA